MAWGSFEQKVYQQGYSLVAGTDEVGRGCLAGPVFAAAVIFKPGCDIPGLNDSKKLSAKKRESLQLIIEKQALAFAVTQVSVEEIDRINILQASLKAMKMAVEKLYLTPDYLLIDGKQGLRLALPQKPIIQGDSSCACIAAASILAKVSRDAHMCEQEQQYPEFSFSQHKGYGTKKHLAELNHSGPSPLHRKSFAPVRKIFRASSFHSGQKS